MWKVSLVILVMIATVSCGAEANTTSEATESSTATTTVLSTPTTTTTSTTSTTAPSTTTTTPTTTTAEAEDKEPSIDAHLEFVAGDCYVETQTDEGVARAVVPCEEPHFGEVFAVIVDIEGDELQFSEAEAMFVILEHLAEYVGIEEDSRAMAVGQAQSWLERSTGVTVVYGQYFEQGVAGVVSMTWCSLISESDGELTGSYRSG